MWCQWHKSYGNWAKNPAELGVLSRCGPPDVSGILFDREIFSTLMAVPRNLWCPTLIENKQKLCILKKITMEIIYFWKKRKIDPVHRWRSNFFGIRRHFKRPLMDNQLIMMIDLGGRRAFLVFIYILSFSLEKQIVLSKLFLEVSRAKIAEMGGNNALQISIVVLPGDHPKSL